MLGDILYVIGTDADVQIALLFLAANCLLTGFYLMMR